MKAIQIQEFGEPEVLKYVEVEKPEPKAGEVLIKIEAASVNYSDIMRRSGAIYPFPTPLPFIPGGEAAGTVEAVGEGVTGISLGTRVFGLMGRGSTGYAEYAVTPVLQAIPIPEEISMEEAASLPIAGTTALLIVREIGNLQQDETILIQGAAGGVGGYAIQIAKALGAGCVIGVTSSEAKFDKVIGYGADHAMTYADAESIERIHDVTGGHGIDVMLEMSGGKRFSRMLAALAPFGRVVVYGMSSGEPLSLDNDAIIQFFYRPSPNQSIHVFNLGMWFGMKQEQTGNAMQDLVRMVSAGEIEVTVDHVLPLKQAPMAHRMIEARENTGKIVLNPWR